MRDVLNTFGNIKITSANTAAAAEYSVDALTADGLGLIDSLYVKANIKTKVPGSTDVVKLILKHSATDGSFVELDRKSFPARVWALGDELKMKIPADHLRYLAVEIEAATTGVEFTSYLERG
jgi:hypothetical protein